MSLVLYIITVIRNCRSSLQQNPLRAIFKYTLFLKPNKVDDIPLKLPELNINNVNIKRVLSMKFLGVIFDQHLNWKEHLKLIENKTSKCIGIMHKVKKKKIFTFHSYIVI